MFELKKVLTVTLSLGALGVCDIAAAQDSLFARDRNTSVLQRERPEYAPQGVRAGSFIVRPRVDLSLGYTDNTFAIDPDINAQFGEQEDFYFVMRPSVQAESNWNRHSLVTGAYVEAYEHVDIDEANALNAGIFADAVIDVSRTTAIELGGAYDKLVESRKVSTADIFDDPIDYKRGEVYAGLRQEFGRIRYRGRLSYADYDYDDAFSLVSNTNVDQDFRDLEETSVLLQAGYAVTRDASVFIRSTFRQRNYPTLTPGGLNRDSEGYTVSAGVDFDVTRLVRGSIALGYLEEEFDDPALQTIDGLSIDAGLEWFPTELTTVGLSASREVRASPLLADAAFLTNEIVLGVDHELARNIIVSASAGYALDDYENLDREDERYALQLAGTYLINQLLSAKLEYTYEEQESDGTTPGLFAKDYSTNELLLTLTAER
ncbi:outer membrane beta-barrel protein [Parvularcula sp. IMCC14364]|uniref:outer membrane beta-barrel protein n=1 Tax=Parvularcula sp. IMCC14364 TaxID=3067902 RepID=UPI00274201A6|nr:outer membrane beta-barrel protein [Parvularcula sp. IMCC14364]